MTNEPTGYTAEEAEIRQMLLDMFVQRNQNKYTEIEKAITTGNQSLAHRLAHTLKGSAGQIGQAKLQKIADDTAKLLKAGKPVPKTVMDVLKTELTIAIEEIKPLVEETRKNSNALENTLDNEQTIELFKRLELMFENLDPECFDLIDALRAVPGAEELINHIEDFDLNAAGQTLAELIEKWKKQNG